MKRIPFIIALISTLLWAGCSREIESENLLYGLPDEPPIPQNLSVTYADEGIRLGWEISDTLEGMSFGIYYSDSVDGTYTVLDTAALFHSDIANLNTGWLYFFKVTAIMSDGLESRLSEEIQARIGLLMININGGDKVTNRRNVSIQFIVPQSAYLIKLAEDPAFIDVSWQNYSPTASFQLSEGDGVKNVYTRIQFSDGSLSDTVNSISDSIILDTQAEIDSVYFTPEAVTFSENDTILFYLKVSEPEGYAQISFPGTNSINLQYDESISNPAILSYIYSTAYIIPDGMEVLDGLVIGRFTDIAENQAEIVNAPVHLNIANDPTAVSLYAVAESSSEIRLTWSECIDSDFSAYHLYRGLDVSVSNTSDPITVIDSRSELTYTDDNLSGSTQYFYIIFVYDNTGKFAASNVVNATTLSAQSPIFNTRTDKGNGRK